MSLVRNRPVDFDHDVGADLAPLQLGRVLHGGQADALAVDDQRVAVDRDVALEAAVHAVVLQHVGQVVGLEQVVDADDLDVVGKFCTAARNTMRPMRPKPLMPTLMVMIRSPVEVKRSTTGTSVQPASTLRTVSARFCGREVEELEQRRRRRALAVAVEADHRGAAVLPPAVGDAGLDRDARQLRRQHAAIL